MTDAVSNRCPNCRYSFTVDLKAWFCHHPKVNKERPSFLAGNNQAAKRCTAERMNVLGYCGKEGKLFEPGANPSDPEIPLLEIEHKAWKLPG